MIGRAILEVPKHSLVGMRINRALPTARPKVYPLRLDGKKRLSGNALMARGNPADLLARRAIGARQFAANGDLFGRYHLYRAIG